LGYLADLQTRASSSLCTGEHPILQLALLNDSIWVASTDSSVHRQSKYYALNSYKKHRERIVLIIEKELTQVVFNCNQYKAIVVWLVFAYTLSFFFLFSLLACLQEA
jgi:hypothetical protein